MAKNVRKMTRREKKSFFVLDMCTLSSPFHQIPLPRELASTASDPFNSCNISPDKHREHNEGIKKGVLLTVAQPKQTVL